MANANITAVITAEDKASGTLSNFGDNMNDMAKKWGLAIAAVSAALIGVSKVSTDFLTDYVKDSKKLSREIGESVTESSRLLSATKKMGLEVENASVSFGIFSKQIVANTDATKKNKLVVDDLNNKIQKTRLEIAETSAEIKKNGDKSGELKNKLDGLNITLSGLTEKLKEANTPFQKLGINTVTATGAQKDFKTLLFEVADKFKAMPDGIDKTALSMELFGRQGKEMIKFLNLGSQGISKLEQEADKLGLTLTPKTIDKVQKYIESQKLLKENTDALKIAIGETTTPVLTKFNDTLASTIEKLNKSDTPFKGIITNVLAFGGYIGGGFIAILAAGGSAAQLFGFTVSAAISAIVGLIIAAVAIWTYNIVKIIQNFDALKEAFVLGLGHIWRNLVQWGTDVINLFVSVTNSIGNTIINAFKGLGNLIVAPWRWAFNEIARLWNNTVGKLSFHAPSWVPGIGGKGWDVPDIPTLAQGGVVTKPTLAVIGEAGPEAVVPLNRAGGIQPNIVVNIGMYAGTEIEKRKIAKELMRVYNQSMGTI